MSYNLRKREQIAYHETDRSFTDNDGDCTIDTSLSSSSDSSFTSPQEFKKPRLQQQHEEKENEDTDTSDTPYFAMIKKNIEMKNEMLKALGFFNTSLARPVTTPVKKVNRKFPPPPPPPPREKSLRIQGKRPSGEFVPQINKSPEPEPELRTRKQSGPIPMKSIGASEEQTCDLYFDGLLPHLHAATSAGSRSTNSLDSFKNSLKMLALDSDRIVKVTRSRIASLAIHPSETKLLVVAGDVHGQLGFWDVLDKSSSSLQVFEPHVGSIHCTSFCNYDSTVLYTTAIEGSVRRGDLNKLVFDDFYTSDEAMDKHHTTWHCQMDAHTLMVAHGNGTVAFVDSRSTQSPAKFYECHSRSVRTVDRHPLQDIMFVTSSNLGEVRIWDTRHMKKCTPKPVADLVHPKGLKSAFFSPSGNFLLTTCNDDRLRIYQISDTPQVVTNVKHNNHTGRWLTPFKAMWHPQREDIFVVGSMEYPRRVEVFGIHGKIVHELRDEELKSVQSCCQFHPTQQILAGANSGGKVHVFMARESQLH